jgi:murein DD-endopeptidase MepM/ murein hydrolase activator NlpD
MRLRLFTGVALLLLVGGAPVRACVNLGAEPVQGMLLWGRVPPGHGVMLDGEALPVLPDGWFLAAFERDAAPRSRLAVTGPDGCERVLDVAQREYRIQRVEGVPQRTVTPPPEQLERIRRERARVFAAKARRIERPEWLRQVDGGFAWPAQGPVSGVYGSQRFYNGTPGTPHYGVDVAAPTGTPVRAPAAGLVTLAEPDLFYSGGTVILDHGYGLSSSFLHMSEVSVAVGEEIARGEVIGAVGASGRATGPHLDWRMSWRGRRVDPQPLVPPMPKP